MFIMHSSPDWRFGFPLLTDFAFSRSISPKASLGRMTQQEPNLGGNKYERANEMADRAGAINSATTGSDNTATGSNALALNRERRPEHRRRVLRSVSTRLVAPTLRWGMK